MTNDLFVRSPRPETDYEDIVHLTAACFGGYWDWVQRCEKGYLKRGPYDWATSRIGRLPASGELTTHFGVYDFRMRVAGATLRTAGVGAVCTHGAHRKHGYLMRTAQASIDAMSEASYAISVLYGITNFYHRLGYVPAWPDTVWTLRLPDAARPVTTTHSAPAYEEGEAEDMDSIFNRENEGIAGTYLRPTWPDNIRGHEWTPYRWKGAGERPGTVLCAVKDHVLRVADVIGDPEDVLAVAIDLADRRSCNRVEFVGLSVHHPLAARLRRARSVLSQRYTPHGEAMIRIVNLEACMQALEPEFQKRAVSAPDGRMLCVDQSDSWLLTVQSGRITLEATGMNADTTVGETATNEGICVVPQEDLAAYLVGAREDYPWPEDTLQGALMRHMLPALHPSSMYRDHF